MGGEHKDKYQHRQEEEDDSSTKIHISRIPTNFTEENVVRILEERLGAGSVVDVTLIYPKGGDNNQQEKKKERESTDQRTTKKKDDEDPPTTTHRGFGFAVLATAEAYQQAMTELPTIRAKRTPTSRKTHTLYVRPYHVQADETQRNLCFLWTQHRCPYGTECKFLHEGDGGCLAAVTEDKNNKKKKKKKPPKCFAFKKTGKCSKGDACPFSHDVVAPCTMEKHTNQEADTANATPRPDAEKDCINWKTKGKCRKGDACPYRHDANLQLAALAKKNQKRKQQQQQQHGTHKKQKTTTTTNNNNNNHHDHPRKYKQPLWVRIFGLSYETREIDVRQLLEPACGKICQLEFPRFSDSGRSKGYCGVRFASPKCVQIAVEQFDGYELHQRWWRVQAGPMLLDQWQAREEEQEQQQQGDGGGGDAYN